MNDKTVRYELIVRKTGRVLLDVDNSSIHLDEDDLLGSCVLEDKVYLLYKNDRLVAKLTPDKRTFLYLFRDYWLMSDEEQDMTTEIEGDGGTHKIVECTFCGNAADMTIVRQQHAMYTGEYDDENNPEIETVNLSGYTIECNYCGYQDGEPPML